MPAKDVALFAAVVIGAALIPLLLGVFATRKLGTALGSFLVGLVLGLAPALAIDPLLGAYGLFAWFMAALPGNDWRLLHAIGDAMSADRRRRHR